MKGTGDCAGVDLGAERNENGLCRAYGKQFSITFPNY